MFDLIIASSCVQLILIFPRNIIRKVENFLGNCFNVPSIIESTVF